MLKILLSFSEEVYFMDNYRIVQSELAPLIIKALELGQEIISLAYIAVKCLKKMFQAEKNIAQKCLASAIPSLDKYINVESNTQKE